MKIAEFDIEVERKPIKNIHLAVYPPDGRIHVSIPETMKDDDLSMFLFSKLSWIRQKREEVLSQERQAERKFVTGESHFLLGRRYLLRVRPTNGVAHVEKQLKYLDMYVRKGVSRERKQECMDTFYRQELRMIIEPLIAKWSERMDEAIDTFSWSILLMQNQWGSCTTESRKIQFNLLLARVPIRCIEYIVVHEMTHLKIHQHNNDFILTLNKYLPDWNMRKKELDEFIALPLSN